MIPVTKPYLPPLEEYEKYLEGIWERCWVTNAGPLVEELENKLKTRFGVKHVFFVANGTLALQIAIKALDLKKEIITTPFSYVATTSSIAWENCTPVFVDIEEDSLSIDANLIEDVITGDTEAILATHVFGNPCNVEKIKEIADKHSLKVIYDAAHAFDVRYKDTSLLQYGDVSTLSFHATKLFHTIEGGAILTDSDEIADEIFYKRNFGHKGYEDFNGIGINGKNSEVHAAMGLCILPVVEELIKKRKKIIEVYDSHLGSLFPSKLKKQVIAHGASYNYSYYPVIFNNEASLLEVQGKLNENDIIPRRYFYPSLSVLDYVNKFEVPIALGISQSILCLPLYNDLAEEDVKKVCDIIIENLN